MLGFDVLDPDLDLLSNHFVEASAGTGKTFAIENIVSRLIQEKKLKLDEILVVTFTRAATFELKNRIRRKVESLDEEKIFTIHSFCFHTLREFAFDSGISLDQMEESASNEVLKQAAKDYLRTCTFPPKQIEILLKRYQNDFDALLMHLVSVASRRIPIQTFAEKPLPEFDKEKLLEDLIAQAPLFGKMCNRQKEIKPEIIEGFKRFVEGDIYETPLLLMVPKNRLKRSSDPYLHYPSLLPELVESVQSVSDPQIIFANLAEQIRLKLEEVIAQKELLFFEDLIRMMEKNVRNETFAAKVRARYKAVLIDEFQDTDAQQWSIFKTLFLGHVPLYLVGDPKQAIYRFRGADLYTYMQAKQEMGAVSILEKNFRSTPALLEVLNTLFSQTPFELPLTSQKLEYHPVKVGEEKENLLPPVYLLTAKDENELFERVVQQIDPRLTTAVLVKDRFQAKRFEAFCPFPTLLAKGRTLDPLAFQMLDDLLGATLDPYDHDAAKRVTQGLLSSIKPEDFLHLHHFLQEHDLLTFFKMVMEKAGEQVMKLGGEDLYLDLLQLVEMLAEQQLPPESYLSYLQELALADEEERKARPRGKEGAVLIMTTHASKGLEFDVVFPIGLAMPQTKQEGLVYSFDKQMLCFPDENHEREIEAELVRQIYVAFTRAKKRLYIPRIEGKSSPLTKFMEQIHHTIEEAPIQPFKKCSASDYPLIRPPEIHYSFTSCPIHSFSSLSSYVPEKKEIISDIPAGAEIGVLLHNVLESVSFQNIDVKLIKKQLYQTLLEPHADWVIQMVHDIADLKLPASKPFALREVSPQKMLRELEFLYRTEAGYMKGFIDLVFEHNDQFYLIDWKSNLIEDSIEEEMKRHNYFLQAKIYSEAFQKYSALFDSKPIDKVFYLFLREKLVYPIEPRTSKGDHHGSN